MQDGNKRNNTRRRDVRREKELERLEAKAEHELAVHRYAEYEFKRDPITEVPEDVKLPTYYFDDVRQKVEYNNYYADHYWQRFLNTNLHKYETLSQRVRNCHKSWFGDRYKQTGYFNVKRVFHCHNRWCWLCNHLKQAKRLYEYTLLFDKLLKDYDLYHLVFTLKNVPGNALKDTLLKMQLSFKNIVRYFNGDSKVKGIDFLQYGFVGALRSFEIVINPQDYHPHIHSLFLLKKDLEFPKTEICKFSFSNKSKVPVRKFSKFERLLQKIFYLLMNGQKVTVQNIDTVSLGYSCTMDLVEDDEWHEVFKYATKMSKDGSAACTYDQFVLLDDILHKFRMLQGYGIFYDADKENPDEVADQQAEILFEKVLILLNQKEKPECDVSVALDKLVDEIHQKKTTVISKKLSYKYLQSFMKDLKAELGIIEDTFEPF